MAGMKSLKKTRRIQVISLAGLCVAAVLLILALLISVLLIFVFSAQGLRGPDRINHSAKILNKS